MNRTAAANGSAQAVEAQAESGLLERVVEATASARQYTMEELRYMAKAASQSRLFGMEEAQAFVLMQLCEAEGLHPIQALRRYDIIDGKPAMKAAAMQAEFLRRGGRITWVERSAEACEGEFTHPAYQPQPLKIRTTLKELKDRGIATAKDGGLKRNYQQNPRAMLHARVISEGIRAIDPGIVVGLYTPEEASDFDDRPSPRPLPADAPASRVEPVVAKTPAEPTPQPSGTLNFTGKDWVQALINEYEGDWAAFCVKEGKPHRKLVENIWQAINGVVTRWAEDDPREKEFVEVNGVRKKGKVAVRVGQAFESDRHATEEDFRMYLDDKWGETATALGVNLDAEPKEESPA